MCKEVVRLYPLCTPDQPSPPWHQIMDETLQCQEAVNRGGVLCEELGEPHVVTIKNSRCPPCLLHDQQEHHVHETWEKEALAESEELATKHAEQLAQRQADLARQEEEYLRRVLQESEQTAQQSSVEQGTLDNEEDLHKALEASMGTTQEDEQRRSALSGDSHEEELRRAVEASMGTAVEDEQRRTARSGPCIFFIRHVKKMCCGKVIKEKTDIEKDADSDGIPFLEEEDDVPCDECIRRMFAEQDALQFGGSSTGADVPTVRTGDLPPELSTAMLRNSDLAITDPSTEEIDLDPIGRGKAPWLSHPPNTPFLDSHTESQNNFNQMYPPIQAQPGITDTNPPDSSPPGYMSSMNLSVPAVAPSPGTVNAIESREITYLQELIPKEAKDEDTRKQHERHVQMNAPLHAQGRTDISNSARAWSRDDQPSAVAESDDEVESRPASPRTVMGNKQREDAAREHLAAARAILQNLQKQRTQPQTPIVSSHGMYRDSGQEEDDDALGDLPENVSRMRASSIAPSSRVFRRGGLRPYTPTFDSSSSSSALQGPSAPQGPGDHDWDHDWLGEESNRMERLPSFASSLDVSKGTRPVPDQETE